MAAGVHNILIEQGSTFTYRFTWFVTDNPVNLTGYMARMGVYHPKIRSDYPVVFLTTENQKIVLGGISGTIDLSLSAVETGKLNEGVYAYDLELLSGSYVNRILRGNVTVSKNWTI